MRKAVPGCDAPQSKTGTVWPNEKYDSVGSGLLLARQENQIKIFTGLATTCKKGNCRRNAA